MPWYDVTDFDLCHTIYRKFADFGHVATFGDFGDLGDSQNTQNPQTSGKLSNIN